MIYRTYSDFIEICKGRTTVFFGCGKYLQSAIKLMENDISISYLTDNDFWKWGNYICGYEVIPPAQIWLTPVEDAVVLITNTHIAEIEKTLIRHNITKYYAYLLFPQAWNLSTKFSTILKLNGRQERGICF